MQSETSSVYHLLQYANEILGIEFKLLSTTFSITVDLFNTYITSKRKSSRACHESYPHTNHSIKQEDASLAFWALFFPSRATEFLTISPTSSGFSRLPNSPLVSLFPKTSKIFFFLRLATGFLLSRQNADAAFTRFFPFE